MVSGTAGMYGMMYARGHPSIFDEWAKMGNKGWSYAEIEKYFERAEYPINNKLFKNGLFRSLKNNGPMVIDYFSHSPEFSKDILLAATELGYRISSLRGRSQAGFMIAPMLTENGLRGTTVKYYLKSMKNQKNLKVLTNTHVSKIIFDSWSDRAIGIEVLDKNNEAKIIMASKEIILTAGAIGSPQILLQSGIGPKEDLEKLNIKVIKNLPVGKNLQNHVSVSVKMSIEDTNYESISVDAVNEFLLNRSGPLASTGLTQLTGFIETSFAKKGVPDIQVFFDGFSSECVKTGLKNECQDGSIEKCPTRREIIIRPTVVNAKSKGYLKLNSTNPLEHPLIYPNYFTHKNDIEVLLEGIKKVIEFTKTDAMKKWDLKLENSNHQWCSRFVTNEFWSAIKTFTCIILFFRFNFGSDEYWKCLIRAKTGPENHQSGTCKMGPESKLDSVVDSYLKVHGIPNLRVADASIFPILTNANPVASIIMVAEKASEIIYQSWAHK